MDVIGLLKLILTKIPLSFKDVEIKAMTHSDVIVIGASWGSRLRPFVTGKLDHT